MKFEPFQNNLRTLINENHIKNLDLARALRTTPVTISRYLTGMRNPNLETLIEIADYFSVSIDWLLGRSTQRGDIANVSILEKYNGASLRDRKIIDIILEDGNDLR